MRRMRRTIASARRALLALAAAYTAGCASTSTSTAAPGMTPAVLIDEHGQVYRTTDGPATMRFPTSPESTFRAVVAGFIALGLEPSAVDPARGIVARQRMVFRSRFQGRPLSSIFDCGDGQFGSRADEGRILADITTRVVPSGPGSSVSTTIQASLTPNDGVARDPLRCVSNGSIEEQLRREVTINLGLPYERSR